MYTGDEERPLESLFIWDISSPSQYLPSEDPSGQNVNKAENDGSTNDRAARSRATRSLWD